MKKEIVLTENEAKQLLECLSTCKEYLKGQIKDVEYEDILEALELLHKKLK
jgi:hypothetical protein